MLRRRFCQTLILAGALLVGRSAYADVAHQVHLVQQVEVDGEIVETIDLTPYTGDGFTTSNATERAGYIFTHWSTSAVQEFANRDPWGRAYEQVAFSLYETTTNTAHYVREDLDADGDGLADGLELYWYGDLDETPASDTDGDGIGFARELEMGTNPHFADTYTRGMIGASAKPQFFKLVLRCEPEGALFATVTNNVAPGVAVTTDAYSPVTTSFAHWSSSDAAVATRDAFGRAFDALAFAMPTNDVELVAVCRDDAAARHSLYWYGNETTELTSDADGDGLTLAEEIRVGTNPLFADAFVRGVIGASAKPQFCKLILRSEPEGALFATVTNNVAPGVAVTTTAYNPATSAFAHWEASDSAIATRGAFGRALDALSFAMMTNDVELVAVCRDDTAARHSLYWYGNEATELTSDTDGDGLTFAEEIRLGTNPLFADSFVRGVIGASAKPQFCKLIVRSEPEGSLFATVTNDVAPGVAVTTDAYSPVTTSFAHWSSSDAAVATRDAFGRAFDALAFAMPTNDVELVAVCRDDTAARHSLYWYGNEATELSSDSDGDGLTFAEEVRVGTNPLFADSFVRGVIGASVKPQFFKLVLRCEPEGALFATVTNDVAPGVAVTTDAYSPVTTSFAHWSSSDAAVATRDVFGRAFDALAFAMPTNDVELVAVCRDDAAARHSLYWYGNETTELTSDTDGDGLTLAEEVRLGTNPLFADRFSRGILFALSEELETDLQPFEQMRGAIVNGEYVELFTSGLAGNAGTSETFGENACPLAVDVDGDGLFDLVVVSRGSLRIFLNKGSAANPDFAPTTADDAWANFRRLLRDMARPLVCTANGVFYVSDGGGPIYAFTLADGTLAETGLAGIPGLLDGRLFALTAAGTLVADWGTLALDTPVIGGVSVSTADIDADGRTDLLVSDSVGHIWLYRNVTAADAADGAASFKLLHKVWAGTGVGFAEDMAISLVDWDDDGDYDVLIGTPDGKLMLLRDPRTGRPTNVRAYPGADNVLLTWDPNSQPRIRGYNVYRAPDAESFMRIANQTPLPRYRDVPGVLRDYWYRVTGVSRFYIAGNSTPTVYESMPTDAVYVQFRPSVWLNDTSGFTGSNVTVVVSMNNSMGISADGLSMTFAYDADVLAPVRIRTTGLTDELEGAAASVASAGTWRFAAQGGAIATGAGQFLLLDFKIKEVHDVTETTVSLVAATVKALDGRAVALDLPKSATVEIGDSNPIVPAIVAVSVADSAVDSETEFALPVTVTATETLTNFTATLTWDATLLEMKGISGGTRSVASATGGTHFSASAADGTEAVPPMQIATSGGDFTLSFYAKDPASAATNFAARVSLSGIAAVDCHGFAVTADDAAGTVLVKNAHPWVPARVSISTEDQKVDTLEEVVVPFKVTSDETLASGAFTVEWNDAVLECKSISGGTHFSASAADGTESVPPLQIVTFGGDFSLTFLARDQHDVTMTQVRLTAASVTDVHGFTVAPSVPVVSTILIHDAHPLIPAQVAMTLADVRTQTETEFEMTLAVSSTETLTHLVLDLDYDADLLELKSVSGGTRLVASATDGTEAAPPVRLVGADGEWTFTFYAKENHTVDSTAVSVTPVTGFDHNGLAAVLPEKIVGTVVFADSNPWQPATVSVGVGSVKVDTRTSFDIPVTVTSNETLTNFTATVEWDADVLELRGVSGGTRFSASAVSPLQISTSGGDFTLTFYAKDQHTVTRTDVRLVDITAVDEHGLDANAIADATGTVLIHDAHPLIPANVSIRAGDAQVKTLQSFSIPVTVTSSKTLTRLSVSVGYDAAVLEFRGCVGATWNDGAVTAEGTVPQSLTLTFYAKDQHSVTETAITLSDGAATCTDALAANVTCADGMIRLTDSNPPVAPTFALSVLDVRAESGQPFVVNVGTESVGDLAETTLTVEWDAAKMSFAGARETATVETLSDSSRRLTFASSGTDNRYHLNFTAAKIAGLHESAQVRVTAVSATGANGLAGVLQTPLPVAASVLIVREIGRYDPGDVDGDGRYTDADLDKLNKYIAYLNVLSTGNKYAIAAMEKYRLTGQALKAADVNCDGVVDANDVAMLAKYIAAAKEAE